MIIIHIKSEYWFAVNIIIDLHYHVYTETMWLDMKSQTRNQRLKEHEYSLRRTKKLQRWM